MERLAVLIEASNVRGEDDLPGARDDIKNWEKFLMSDLGGGWCSSEIITREKPSLLEITTILMINRHKYCFVIFSGHGYHDTRCNITRICLNDSEKDVAITDIKPKGSKGTLIIDACRGIDKSSNVMNFSIERMQEVFLSSNASVTKSIHTADSCGSSSLKRRKWLENLSQASTGKLTMYACEVGQGAGEFEPSDATQGGYFTTSLILAARRWDKIPVETRYIQNTLEAFNSAVSIMKSQKFQQDPVYDSPPLVFPFAVKL